MRSGLLLIAAFVGCAPPPPQREVLDARVALSELRQTRVTPPSGGLSPDDAVATALVHNRDLRTLRRERRIAEGAVLSAGAWKNPELRLGLDRLLSGNPVELMLGLRMFPPPPGEREAQVERAKARERRVLAEIEARENTIAAAVRLAHARLLLLAERRRLLEAEAKLQEDVLRALEQRIAANVSTALDLSIARLELAEVEGDRFRVVADERAGQAELSSLLGVASAGIPLVSGGACEPSAPASDAELERLALRRPDLLALQAAYDERDEDLRLERIAQSAWPKFVEPRASNIGNEPGFDVHAAIELPIHDAFDRTAEERREKIRDEYLARLQDVRVKIRAARAELAEMEARRRYVAETVEPALAQAEEVLRTGLDSGEVDPIKLAALGRRVLQARIASSEALFQCEKTRLALSVATGTLLSGRTK